MKLIKILTISFLTYFLLTSLVAQAAEKPKVDLDKYPGLKTAVEKSEFKDKVIEALNDAGTNWENLASAIAATDGQKQADLMWLITVMPHLDRLEATKDILLEHLEYAYKAKTAFEYKIPDNMFREYILAYRMGYEPVTSWRGLFFERFKNLAAATPSETAKNVNKWVAENIIIQKHGIYGPQLTPEQILKCGRGAEGDISTITAAILKALGIPSRSVRCKVFGQQKDGASWVEVYDGEKWVPLYPTTPDSFGDFGRWEKEKPHNITVVATKTAFDALQITPGYTQTGKLEISVYRNGIVQENFEHISVAAYNNGGWLPLDDLGFNLEESRLSTKTNVFEAILGDGTYLVEAGVRNHNGDVYMYTKQVEIAPDAVIPMRIDLDPPIEQLDRADIVAREIKERPDWELPIFDKEGTVFSSIVYIPDYSVLAIFNISEEPSLRMIPLLVGLKPDDKTRVEVVGIHAGPVDAEKLRAFIKDNNITFPIVLDVDGKVVEKYGLTRKKDDKNQFNGLPSIIAFHKGNLIMVRDGYDLGIREFILDVIRYNQSLGW